MQTIADCSPAHTAPTDQAALLAAVPITTTLYDLISALQEAAGPGEDPLVVASMVHLMRSGRLRWQSPASQRQRAAHLAIQEA